MSDQEATLEKYEGGPLVWDMPKLRRWVEAGCDPAHEDCIDAYTLQRIETDGLITIDTMRAGNRRFMTITLTGLGEFEADRLTAVERAASEAGAAS